MTHRRLSGFPGPTPTVGADGGAMPTPLVARHVHAEPVMGTVVSLDVRGSTEAVARSAFAQVMGRLHDVDARFSTYRDDSEINRIDRGELPLPAASPAVRRVLRRCARLREETGGAFDERAGGRLDPSAYVKGWAVQRAAAMLRAAGLTDFPLSAGGDVVVRGGALPEDGWRGGIQHPYDPTAVATAVEAPNLRLPTSGAHEPGDHVLDPRSGRPPAGVLSVTVVGPDLGLADAYATAAFAMGAEGPRWTLGLRGYEAMTILEGDQVLCTPGFPLGPDA